MSPEERVARALLAADKWAADDVLGISAGDLRALIAALDEARAHAQTALRVARGKYGYGHCPLCRADAIADEVDNGVGMQQCGPAYCPECGAFESDEGGWVPGQEWTKEEPLRQLADVWTGYGEYAHDRDACAGDLLSVLDGES